MDATISILCMIICTIAGPLLAKGIHGKRIDDHPLCRRCKFDLTGAAKDSTKCPECGANLRYRSSTVIGHRRRRPVMIGFGSTLLLLAVTGYGLNVGGVLKKVNWNAYKPDWWLVLELNAPSGEHADTALEELVRRDESGRLSQKKREAVLDYIYDVVIPRLQSPSVEWPVVVERAWLDGTLSTERLEKYAHEALGMSIRPSNWTSIRKGDVLRLEAVWNPRFGLPSAGVNIRIHPISVRVGDHEYRVCPKTIEQHIGADTWSASRALNWFAPVDVEAGKETVQVVWRIECEIAGRPETALEWQESLNLAIRVLLPDAESVEFVADDETRKQILDALHFNFVGVRHFSKRVDEPAIVGTIYADRLTSRASIEIDLTDNNGIIKNSDFPYDVFWGSGNALRVYPSSGVECDSLELILCPSDEDTSLNSESYALSRDNRPLWFGAPMTVRVPIKWVDNPDSEGVSEEIRRSIRTGQGWWRQY